MFLSVSLVQNFMFLVNFAIVSEEHHRQCFLLLGAQHDRGHEEEAWLRERVAPRGRSGSLLRAASAEENGTEGQSQADREIGFPR